MKRRLNYGAARPIEGNLLERRKRLKALVKQIRLGESVLGAVGTVLAARQVVGQRAQQLAGSDKNPDLEYDTPLTVGIGVSKGAKKAGAMATPRRQARLRRRWRKMTGVYDAQGKRVTPKPTRPTPKAAPPAPTAPVDPVSKAAQAPRTLPKSPKYRMSGRAAATGAVGGLALAAGKAQSTAWQGFKDQMRAYHELGESEAPTTAGSDKHLKTSSAAPATAKPAKPKKVKPVKPAVNKTATASNSAAEEQIPLTPEEQLQQRAGEIRQRLSAITMATAKPAAQAPAPAKTPATKKEAASAFIGSLLEAKRIYSEEKTREQLGSKADIRMRMGTPLTHTFYSNDRKHLFSGNPLAMRQKIIAEHRRKNFALKPGFENMSPVDVGAYFDELSDKGMLEQRPSLDDSMIRSTWRGAKRVTGRAFRKVKGFFSNLVSSKKKTKESDAEPEFCDFSVGNVKYPHDCDCSACRQLLETSATSFGQNMRSDTTRAGNIFEAPGKDALVEKLLKRRKKRKQRRVRESCEDANYAATLTRELRYHGQNPEPLGINRRPKTYFNVYSDLRRLDRLGMNLALTAVALNRLAPVAHRLLLKKQMGNAEDSANWAKRVFQGVPVREGGDVDPFPDVTSSAKDFAAHYPKTHAFLTSPFTATKKAAQSAVISGAKHFNIPNNYVFPTSVAAAGVVTAAGAYAGKKYVYDPIQRKLAKAKEELYRRRMEKNASR